MKMLVRTALVVALATTTLAFARREPSRHAPTVYAFTNVSVLAMNAEKLDADQTVIIRDDRIESVGPSSAAKIPANATRIDGRGKYLMPGLAEMHAHVMAAQAQGNANEAINKDILLLYLANGITSIRAMLGTPNQLVLRDAINRGEVLGPSMWVSAPSINGSTAPTADSAAKLVRLHKAAGYDFIKLHGGLTNASYDSMAANARAAGLTWAGHVSRDVGVERTIATGQSTIEHLDGYLFGVRSTGAADPGMVGDSIRLMDESRFPIARARHQARRHVEHPDDVALSQRLQRAETPEVMAERPEMKYWMKTGVTGWVRGMKSRIVSDEKTGITPAVAARQLELRRKFLKTLADSGAPLLMGTDSPQLFMVPGFSLHREIAEMAAAGMRPYQIYETGTRNVARYVSGSLKQDGRFGTIVAGNRADLVLLDANPLLSVANLTSRAGVMVRGRWLPKSEIDSQLAELATRMAAR
ncbi:MAG TPA: amidohydrolase family protein [Gemmatimonadaceae bacterium]